MGKKITMVVYTLPKAGLRRKYIATNLATNQEIAEIGGEEAFNDHISDTRQGFKDLFNDFHPEKGGYVSIEDDAVGGIIIPMRFVTGVQILVEDYEG